MRVGHQDTPSIRSVRAMPPSEPPDVTRMSSLNQTLSVTTRGITTIQYLYVYLFTVLQSTLQLFKEMPKCRVHVWKAISRRYKCNELKVLVSELNCQPYFLAATNLFESLSLNTFNVSAQSVLLRFDSRRYFDPDISLLFAFAVPNCNSNMITKLYHIHTWSYLIDFILHGCCSVSTNILYYFNHNAGGRGYVPVSKAVSNEIPSLLSFMKRKKKTITEKR